MPILDGQGNPLPTEAKQEELDEATIERMWAPIDSIIAQARREFGEKWDHKLVEQRSALVMALLPGVPNIWKLFTGQARIAKPPRGDGITQLLAHSAIQILVQWRLDQLAGQEIAMQALAGRDAVSAPPAAQPG